MFRKKTFPWVTFLFVSIIIYGLGLFPSAAQNAPAGMKVLRGHVPEAVTTAPMVGSLPAAQSLRLAIGLPLRDPQGLQDFLKQAYDPHSPLYRRFLTPDEFTARFAPTQADYQAVLDFAKAHNLRVAQTHSNRLLVDVVGAVSDIQGAFQVNLHNYQRPDGSLFHAPDSEPSVDSSLPIAHIAGLENFRRARNHAVPVSKGARANVGTGQGGLYQGQDLRDAYCNGVSPSLNGSGQSVGLFEFDGYFPSDITQYQSTSTPPFTAPTPTKVLVGGFNGIPVNANGNLEVTLDIDMVNALAPGANVVVYEGDPNGDSEVVADDLFEAMATPPLCNQISCSWFEFGDGTAANLLAQFAAQGQSFFLASGDSGAFGTGDIFSAVPPPGFISPFITDVGGTLLTTTSPTGTPTPPAIAYTSETTWNTDFGASGGGVCTNQLQIPPYQNSVVMAPFPSGNSGSSAWRNVPDVSMVADFLFIISGDFPNGSAAFEGRVAGTSAAAPLWAAFTALANQQGASNGLPPIGFANNAVYSIGQSTRYASDFHDINDNSNNSDNNQDPVSFHAVTGYDLATGWGSPNGQNLINDLAGTAFRVTPSPTPVGSSCGTTSSAQLKLEEFTSLNGNQASETFEVINTGTTPVNLSDISIKFWVDDTTGFSVLGAVNFGGGFGPTNQSVNGVAITPSAFAPACGPDGTHQANWELTVTNNDTRTLAAGQTWVNAQTALHLADFTAFSSTADWYSPASVGAGAFINDPHFEVYFQGSPVAASGGSAPSCRATCTPTFTLTDTHTPTPTATVTPTPTATICACNISQSVGGLNSIGEVEAVDQANGVLYVSNSGTSQVLEFNLNGGTNITPASGSVTGLFAPNGLAFAGGFLYVGEGGQWEKINPATNTHINTIAVPANIVPSLSVASNGDVYVAESGSTTSNAVAVYQPSGSGYALATANLNTVHGFGSVLVSGNTLYVGSVETTVNGGFEQIVQYTKLSESTGSLIFSNPTTVAGPPLLNGGVAPAQMAIDAGGTHLFVGNGIGASLSVLNIGPYTLDHQCSNLGWPFGVAFDASGNVYVGDELHGQVDRLVNCGTVGLTATPTSTPAVTSTATATLSRTPTSSPTPTPTSSPSSTATATLTRTATSTVSSTPTPTPAVTSMATSTPTRTSTASPSATPTLSPTSTATPRVTSTATSTLTRTSTPVATSTATSTPTRTPTSSATVSPTASFTSTRTPSPAVTSTATFTPTRTITSTATSTITRTATPSFTPAVTATPTPTATGGIACGTSSLDLQLEEFGTCGSNQNQETFEVINKGTSAVTLSDITIKFWADDTTGTAMVGAVNYGGCFGQTCTAVTGTAINTLNFSPACGPSNTQQANWEITLSNTDTATLGAGITWANLQTAVHLSSFANFSPRTGFWYSPCNVGSGSTYTNNLNYALYVRGNLVTASGGVPPSCRPLPTCTPSGAVVRSLDLALHGETPTPSAVAEHGTVLSVVAVPNVSTNSQPIGFRVTLGQAALAKVSLFSVAGETVYQAQSQGNAGLNVIPWDLVNRAGSSVASGLYIYVVEIDGPAGATFHTGKVVVLR